MTDPASAPSARDLIAMLDRGIVQQQRDFFREGHTDKQAIDFLLKQVDGAVGDIKNLLAKNEEAETRAATAEKAVTEANEALVSLSAGATTMQAQITNLTAQVAALRGKPPSPSPAPATPAPIAPADGSAA